MHAQILRPRLRNARWRRLSGWRNGLALICQVAVSVAPIGVAMMKARGHRQALRILPWGRGCLDRKSTRLNSSHVSISYAVFCLKKKKRRRKRKRRAERRPRKLDPEPALSQQRRRRVHRGHAGRAAVPKRFGDGGQ